MDKYNRIESETNRESDPRNRICVLFEGHAIESVERPLLSIHFFVSSGDGINVSQ